MEVKIQNIVNANGGDLNQFREKTTTMKQRYTLGDALPDLSTISIISAMPLVKNLPSAVTTAKSARDVMQLDGFLIRPLEKEDEEATLQHLRTFFFMDEPLNINIGLLKDKNERCFELEEYSLSSIKEGTSLLAIDDDGEIVGVCLTHIEDRDHAASEDPSLTCSNPKFRKILRLIHTLEERVDQFGRYPDVQRVMSVTVLSVDGKMRGKGIAKELVKRSRDIAAEEGVQMMRVDCTSHYSARVSASLGYECIYEIPYSEYLVDGVPVFTPAQPHTKATVYVLRIE